MCGAQEALFQVAALIAAADPGPIRLLVPTTQVREFGKCHNIEA